MRSLSGLVFAAVALSAPGLHADVTIRYRTEYKPAGQVPRQMSGDSIIRMKHNRGLSTIGTLTLMMDFERQQITLLDPARKLYATLPASEYSAKIKALLPSFDDPAGHLIETFGLKPKSESRKTGRTEVIQGIRAEEQETIVTLEVPVPVGPEPKMSMKLVLHSWTAAPEEVLRVPAIRELSGFDVWMKYFLSSPGTFDPGFSGTQGVVLRVTTEATMPGQTSPGADPNQPIFRGTMEVTELSTAALEDSLFDVPKDYASAPPEELIRALIDFPVRPDPAMSFGDSGTKASGILAYVPNLTPVERTEPAETSSSVRGTVHLLISIDAQGKVVRAEPLSGPEPLREPAVKLVTAWKYRPVLRDGRGVPAYTDAVVFFAGDVPSPPDMAGDMVAMDRLSELMSQFPRSPQQELADLEQDAGNADSLRRFYALDQLAKAAWKAGLDDKAGRYATESLEAADKNIGDWNYGNAVHDAHTILGLLAARKDDVDAARNHLLASVRIAGSPQLNSFGPTMTLAKALLEKGEQNIVLEYFSLCRNFWKSGESRLQAWSDAVRAGKTPDFLMNLW